MELNDDLRELLDRIKAQRRELQSDEEALKFCMENTLRMLDSDGMSYCDFDRLMARMEQLETRILETELMNKKLLAKLGV